MKQLAFLIISSNPSLRNIAQISSHSFWPTQLIFSVSRISRLIQPQFGQDGVFDIQNFTYFRCLFGVGVQVSLQVRMENILSHIHSLRTKFILAPFDMPTILLGRSGMISTSKHLSFQMEWSDRSRNCFTRRTSLQVSASDTNCKSCTRLY